MAIYLSTGSMAIQLQRNQPRIVSFAAQNTAGNTYNLSSVTSVYLLFSMSAFRDVPQPYGGVLPSLLKNYSTGFTLGGPEITKEFTALEIATLPLGSFIYEFLVSEDNVEYVVAQQGTVAIFPSLYEGVYTP